MKKTTTLGSRDHCGGIRGRYMVEMNDERVRDIVVKTVDETLKKMGLNPD